MEKTKSKALRIQDRISVWPQGEKKDFLNNTHTHTNANYKWKDWSLLPYEI